MQKIQAEQPSYYAVLPANVRYDKRLKMLSRLLYAEITALCNKEGYCWASNSYFCDLYQVSESTIKRSLAELKKYNYVNITITYKNNTKEVASRNIMLGSELPLPGCKTGPTPGCRIDLDNKVQYNTRILNSNKYTPASVKSTLECVTNSKKETTYPQPVSKLNDISKVNHKQQEICIEKKESSAKERKDDSGLSNEKKVFEYYKRVRGINDEDILADYVDFPRFIRSIKKLLSFSKDNIIECFKAIEWVKNWAYRNNMTDEQWNLSTVSKKFYDFKTSKEKTRITQLSQSDVNYLQNMGMSL